jgi:hypothetical protein
MSEAGSRHADHTDSLPAQPDGPDQKGAQMAVGELEVYE